jgi:hypothetical protein
MRRSHSINSGLFGDVRAGRAAARSFVSGFKKVGDYAERLFDSFVARD